MKTWITFFLAVCLCLCSTLAFAQGDPGDGCQSGLDVFFPGMSKADAQKVGAKPAGDKQMKATVTWGGQPWNAVLLLSGKEIAVVGLTRKMTDNALISTFLQDMEERLAVPMAITREVNGVKKQENFAKLAAAGKDAKARHGTLLAALGAYAGQDKGSLTVIFCPEDMLGTLAKAIKNKGDVDEKAAMAQFGDAIVYSLHMDKKDDMVTVVASTFAKLRAL